MPTFMHVALRRELVLPWRKPLHQGIRAACKRPNGSKRTCGKGSPNPLMPPKLSGLGPVSILEFAGTDLKPFKYFEPFNAPHILRCP